MPAQGPSPVRRAFHDPEKEGRTAPWLSGACTDRMRAQQRIETRPLERALARHRAACLWASGGLIRIS